MPYCENCGNEINESTKFCENCGNKIDIAVKAEDIQNEININWNREEFIKEYPPNEIGIITCPRCLGKGEVDIEDIQRLLMEEYWSPGECGYCEGVGKVNIKKFETHEVVDVAFSTVMGDYISDKLDDAFGFSENEELEDLRDYNWNDFDWHEYFGHLPSKSKVYLGENIPQKKLNAFKNAIEGFYYSEYIDSCTIHLYYDDTFFGKGDNGLAIGSTDDGMLILFLSVYRYGPHCGFPFIEIKQLENEKSTLIVWRDGEDDEPSDCIFSSCETLLTALVEFHNDNFKID